MNTQDKERQRIGLYIGLGVGACVLLVLSLVVGIVLGIVINKNIHRTPVFNSSVIKQKLSMCSELTTATLEYHGEVEFDEGEFRWIDKKHFTMEYDAYIEAGINILASLIFIHFIGLAGVALGTVIGMAYRTVFQVHFTSKLLPGRKTFFFDKIP